MITHNWTTAEANDPASDVSKDNMNDHEVLEFFDIEAGASLPAAPAAGKLRPYAVISGTTPNRTIEFGVMIEDGTPFPLFTTTI